LNTSACYGAILALCQVSSINFVDPAIQLREYPYIDHEPLMYLSGNKVCMRARNPMDPKSVRITCYYLDLLVGIFQIDGLNPGLSCDSQDGAGCGTVSAPGAY
jgi:hypothetical protein